VNVRDLIRAEIRHEAPRLRLAAAMGAVVTASAVALLGVSGWFITGAALAGAAGAAAVSSFNFLLPSAAIRLFAVLRTGGRYVERVVGHEAALAALARMRPLLFRALAEGPPRRALALSAGEASARLVEDVEAVQTLFIRRSAVWAMGAGALLSAVLATTAHPLAGAAVLATMAAAAGGGLVMARRWADPAGARLQVETGRLKAEIAALHAAAPELKAYGLEVWARDQATRTAQDLDDARMARIGAEGRMAAWQALCLGLGAAAAFTAAALGGVAQPMAALAALAAVTGVEAAGGLTQALLQRGAAEAALTRLDELTVPAPAHGDAATGPVIRLTLADLILTPPMRLAVVGPSGVGKTSLVERMIGLRPALNGEVEIGGVALEALARREAATLFAYAAQDVRLIDDTVRRNLRLADPEADDARLWTALEDAGLADRVRAAPRGLDLPVGANGIRLSGGERRRLGLARALLRDAPWLVLDEPTEGLDAATERAVLDRLDARLKAAGQGLILISHRRAPLALCDRVAIAKGMDADGRLSLAVETSKVPA
jgi:ATP-binding cassette subfamily C protein CydC